MFGQTASKALSFSLIVGVTGPVFADSTDANSAVSAPPANIVEIFDATCASGKMTAAGLRNSFEAHGFKADWQDDTYGYYTRGSLTANYHIYPGSWNCFVSSQSAAAEDLCETWSAGAHTRLSDGTCIFDMPSHGLTVMVRDICSDSSHGSCTWMQATLTSDRECRAEEDVDLATLLNVSHRRTQSQ